MPKLYLCKQIKSDNTVCGETNPDKFQLGRYTTCKECRKIYLKKFKEEQKVSKFIEKVENFEVYEIIEKSYDVLPISNDKSVKEILNEQKKELINLRNEVMDILKLHHKYIQKFYIDKDLIQQDIAIMDEKIKKLEKKKTL